MPAQRKKARSLLIIIAGLFGLNFIGFSGVVIYEIHGLQAAEKEILHANEILLSNSLLHNLTLGVSSTGEKYLRNSGMAYLEYFNDLSSRRDEVRRRIESINRNDVDNWETVVHGLNDSYDHFSLLLSQYRSLIENKHAANPGANPDLELTTQNLQWADFTLQNNISSQSVQIRQRMQNLTRDSYESLLAILIRAALISLGGSMLLIWYAHRYLDQNFLKPIAELRARLGVGDDDENENALPDDSHRSLDASISEIQDLHRGISGLISQEGHLRKDLTDLQVERDAASSAAQAASDFLASMSHEIRTPMNGIVGMAEILSATDLAPDQRRMISIIQDSSRSLMAILNDILDFSKLSAGKVQIETRPIDIRKVVDSISVSFSPLCTGKGLELHALVDMDVPVVVMGDETRLRQIISNLVSNAIKFTESGSVRIRIINEQRNGDTVSLVMEVEDSGIGIPEEKLGHLFEAYTQADETVTRRFGGTGLGLSIVANLSDLMNGHIDVESTEGKGTTFRVYLPFRVDADAALDCAFDFEGLHLAAVEIDPSRRATISTYVRQLGGAVEFVADQGELKQLALNRLEQQAPFNVVYLGSDIAKEEADSIHAHFEASDKLVGVGFVLAHNDFQDFQQTTMGVVTTPDNPICFYDFVRAVAVAAGRASRDLNQADEFQLAISSARVYSREKLKQDGRLLLVAEDNVTNQEVLRRQLQLLGCDCDIANDGREALEFLKENEYPLLLTDCHMPNLSGYDLARTIREQESGGERHMPIIAITASAVRGEADKCREAGMDDYLSKPFSVKSLRQALEGFLEIATSEEGLAADEFVAGASAVSPVDINFDAALREYFGDNKPAFAQLLSVFLGEVEEKRRVVLAALNAEDIDKAASVAHQFKSNCRYVGMNGLADTYEEIENRLLETGKAASVGSAIARMEGAESASINAVQAWLDANTRSG